MINDEAGDPRSYPSGWKASDRVVSFGGIWVGGGTLDELRLSPSARGTDYLLAVQESHALPIFEYETIESR